MENKELIWNEFLNLIKKRVSSLGYDTWFKDTYLYSLGDEAVIVVPTIAHKKHLAESYEDLIEDILNSVTGTNFQLKFILEDEIKDLDKNKKEDKNFNLDKEKENINNETGVPYNSYKKAHLNPEYTFENFVVGESNKFAQATALAVAENPGKMYNPLFIYGNSGLGKTHLMHAIGNYIVEHSNKKVLYITSDDFINDYLNVNNFNKNKDSKNNFEEKNNFKDKYRNVDVLIIDDIQFLGSAPKTQTEFFHTFNSLFEEKKQIIISSDNSPDDIKNLEDRLKTRFNWGLKVNIFPPDNELRKKIIKYKIANMSFESEIDDEVIDYIANTCQSDVRNIEGALTRVFAYSTIFYQERITLDLAIEALKGTKHGSTSNINKYDIIKIQRAVANYYNLTVDDLKSKRRVSKIKDARHLAIYLSRTLTDESFTKIGIEFGGRDHSTIMNSYDKIKKDLETNKQLEKVIEKIKQEIE